MNLKKKTNTHFSDKIKGFVLFQSDLSQIINMLSEEYSLGIEIEDREYVYSDLNEVKSNKGTKPDSLKITGSSKAPYVKTEISFNKNEVSISSYGSIEATSLGYRLRDYCQKSVPWHYKIFRPYLFYMLFWMPLCFLFYPPFKPTLYYASPALLILWLFTIFLRRNAYGVILHKQHEYGFWKRNKDKLILAIITTIFGAIIGVIATLLFK